MINLPIDELLPEILENIRIHKNLVITASPGSGKTTRVPPAVLKSGIMGEGKKILVLVPRRVAAKYAAERVAYEMNEECGQTVGYQFRFEKRRSSQTQILFVTEGLLMRFVLSDPSLKDVGLVILDEFHERHLHSDVAFLLIKNLQNTTRPDLKILVMSATMEANAVMKALGECGHINQTLKPHELSLYYQPLQEREFLENAVARVVQSVLRQGFLQHGHILVFLPGMAQIRKCEEILLALNAPKTQIFVLHGDLSRRDQDLIFDQTENIKIILSTNIAESSVTIPGVHTVIDSGLHRQAQFSSWSGLPFLVTAPVSQASATQRAGRAARTGKGQCIRLYSEHDYSCRQAFDVPEIRRSELSQVLLELMACGFTDFEKTPWFEVPPAGHIQQALALLQYLGAVQNGVLTPMGEHMTALPMHPRLSRLLLSAQKTDVFAEALVLAAKLSEGVSDSLNLVENLQSAALPDTVKRVAQTWHEILAKNNSKLIGSFHFQAKALSKMALQELSDIFFQAFPDRVAKIRTRHVKRGEKLVDEWVMSLGGEVLVESGKIDPKLDFITIVEARSTSQQKSSKTTPWVSGYVALAEEQLLDGPKELLQETSELIWDNAREAILQAEDLKYGSLVLSSSKGVPQNPEATLALLLKQLFKWDLAKMNDLSCSDLEHAIKHYQDPETFLASWARLELYQKFYKTEPDAKIVASPGEALKMALLGISQWRELRDCDLGARLLAALPSEDVARIQEQLPEKIQMFKGRPIKIHYAPQQKPWIESRLQDFFGTKKTPSLLNGQLPLTVHLLAPNGRAVQVTSDLAGFWQNTYPSVRIQLMRRYPKHQWPENPK